MENNYLYLIYAYRYVHIWKYAYAYVHTCQVGAPTMLKDDKYLPGDLGFDPLGLYKVCNKPSIDM